MADRVANVIILAEDQEHQNLVRRYLLRADYDRRGFRPVPLPGNRRCGSQYVREQFPIQVKECRKRVSRQASCLLIVISDADNLTTDARERTLHNELTKDSQSAVARSEPVVILIPKWQVETWIKCLLGEAVEEDDKKTDQPPVTPQQITTAARTLYDWARPGAESGRNLCSVANGGLASLAENRLISANGHPCMFATKSSKSVLSLRGQLGPVFECP